MTSCSGQVRFEWHEMASFVSAITLSSLRIWDPAKLRLLAKLYRDKTPHVLGKSSYRHWYSVLYYYDDRLSLYPEVMQVIKELLRQNSGFREQVPHCGAAGHKITRH
ncbi:MAG: hypothetical protein MZV63_02075 [Marinilabiliales bacterium]|nr:hypothetical protein [Marinilabiliales bacterium]